tara:strand:+ start:111 stop:275 length:165 start_codon:yes stop_codon:yes gene_type:complete
LANFAVSQYLQEHSKFADFSVQVYGIIGDKCLEIMHGTVVPFMGLKPKLGIGRL